MRVAVMQPYFYPYLGYFRLIAAVDLFVVLDTVQFPRRGRVHRAPLPAAAGGSPWLTLPLAHQPQDTAIRDIRLAPDRDARWQASLARLPWLAGSAIGAELARPLPERLAPFLAEHLARAADRLGLATPMKSAAEYPVDPALRGQARILALARAAGASAYWNLPGGRALYEPEAFAAAGLALHFLPAYEGPYMSMLHAFATTDAATLRRALHDRTAP